MCYDGGRIMKYVGLGCWCIEHQSIIKKMEDGKMLDSEKRYFVAAGGNLRNVLESWANENTMKLAEKGRILPEYGVVYELDVQCNEDLRVAKCFLGVGYPRFYNGKCVIGKVRTIESKVTIGNAECVVVYPEIRDR